MRITVVVCTHSEDRYPYLREAVESVLAQTYTNRELIIVSDGSQRVAERARNDYADRDVRVHLQEPNQGLLAARNTGASLANGDVVAFLDDDAVAEEDWLAELATVYQTHDEDETVLAAGGKMTPLWVADKPKYLPEEFYWLIGVTHRGFADGPGEVRNTFGSNISICRTIFTDLGGFDTEIGGRTGDKHLQGGETELCARLRERHSVGVQYNPDARVAHKVFKYRTKPVWLVKRAFWQGYSKRGMEVLIPESTGKETEFLNQLFCEFIPERLTGMVGSPSTTALAQFVALFVLTGAVGAGYLYGAIAWR